MKVVFLDFDGVLNSLDHYKAISGKRETEEDAIDTAAVQRLNRLLERTGASVVISSSWRVGRKIVELREMLNKRGFKGKIIGKTPYLNTAGKQRGHEIEAWLGCSRRQIDSFVILDDDSDMVHLKTHLVQTSFMNGGLLDEHVERAEKMLEIGT